MDKLQRFDFQQSIEQFLEQNQIYELFEGLLKDLVANRPDQPLDYLIQKLSKPRGKQYQELTVTDITKIADIKTKSATLMEDFSGTPYAGRAAVFAAKANFAANDSKSAKSQLEWAIKNAKETAVQAIASLQLAEILYDEKSYDEATKVLSAISDKGFEGLKSNLQGDVLLAQGKNAEAKKAFENALTHLDEKGRMHQYTQQKLESLGV
jgi:predicted negative regulator of RcsB-dependent stress response